MTILNKLGGLVAVAAILMAAGALLVSPTPVHAAADGFCSNAAQTSFLAKDATAGPALTEVASGSTTKARVYIDAASADQLVTFTASAGSITSAVLASTVGADNNSCSTAGLDNVLMGAGVDDAAGAVDDYGTITFIAPTVTTDTLVTITIDHNQDAVVNAVMALTVKATVTPDSLTLGTVTNTAIPATTPAAAATNAADISVTLKEGSTVLVGQTITVITTSGLLESDAAGKCQDDGGGVDVLNVLNDGVQACTATTIAGGVATVSLFGASATGIATVTFVKGSLSVSKDITLFGSASSSTAALKQSTMQASADTNANRNFITLTVLDSSGNPVPSVSATSAVSGGAAVPVTTQDNAPNKLATEVDCTAGTNSKGQCVIQVNSLATTTAGDHTITLTVAGVTAKPVLTVKVVGVTTSITNDAPASVAGSSQTEIIATGVDANSDNVGNGIATTATIIEGNGGLLNVDATTTGGEQKFTFVAPSSAGTTTILVTMGTASQLITVSVGAAAPTPGAGFAGTLSAGVNLTTYGGGSVEQLGTDATDAGASSVSVTVDGAFIVYVVGAPAFVNQAFTDQYPDGVPAGTVVLVLSS